MNIFAVWLGLWLSLGMIWGASAEESFLEPDQAFALSVEMKEGKTAQATWKIAKGYYLYRDRISVSTSTPNTTVQLSTLPSAVLKNDPNFGDVYIYKKELVLDMPIVGQGAVDITIKYQGCAEQGLCYPPQKRTFSFTLPNSAPAASPLSLSDLMGKSTLTTSALPSAPTPELLTPDQAFALTHQQDAKGLTLSWKVASGYYLYQNRLMMNGKAIPVAQLPSAEKKVDPVFGDVMVYKHDFSTTLTALPAGNIEIEWQGCAEAGVCYPPQKASITVTASAASPTQSNGTADLSETDQIANMLSTGSVWMTIAFFFGIGLLLAFTPCVFPMIPILSSIIVGQGSGLTTRRAFVLSLVYVLAMALTYTVAGVLAGLFGANLQAAFQNPMVLISFSLIFIALSLSMFGFYELQLPAKLQAKLADISNQQQGGTLTGVAIMGLLSALIVGPCVAPPLAGALIYIGQTGDALLGGVALFALSMGMGVPLLMIGTAAGRFMPRAGAWMDNVKAIFGVSLLAVAIWMMSRILPDAIVLLLWAILAIASGVYLGALSQATTGWHKLAKSIGLVLLAWGMFLLIAVASGGNSALKPLAHLASSASTTHTTSASSHPQFVKVDTHAALDAALAQAQSQGKAVLLDFYADWCVSCKEMEALTFTDPRVSSMMQSLVLLQIDITANTAEHQALLKRFGLVGPPAILLFNAQSVEQRSLRTIGFMNADQFSQQLTKLTSSK